MAVVFHALLLKWDVLRLDGKFFMAIKMHPLKRRRIRKRQARGDHRNAALCHDRLPGDMPGNPRWQGIQQLARYPHMHLQNAR